MIALALAAALAFGQGPETRILLIGDSHSTGFFGKELDRLLRTLPKTKVRTEALGGASPWWWFRAKGPVSKYTYSVSEGGKASSGERGPTPFSQLVAEFKPTVVVVALGANEQGSPPSAEKSAEQMSKAVVARPARCIWVGPARRRDNSKLDALYDALKKGTQGRCDLVDSRYPWLQFPEGGKDAVHYDQHGSKGRDLALRWAQEVYADLRLLLKL